MKKAIVAMSGGVDSAVTAYLATEQGYDVTGITLKLFDNDDIGEDRSKSCCSLDDVNDAKNVAYKLGIPHYVLNFRKNFAEAVIDRFVSTYKEGGTPNPCIDCNRYIKFQELLKRAEALEFDYVMTGHYAIREYDEKSGRYILKKAVDETKDQSYVLYCLSQEQLKKTMFPLGGLLKADVRKIAEENGFINAKKADSQDICFVKDGDYARFIEEYTGEKSSEGDFITTDGCIIGRHKGLIHYTIGQRKGLGLSVPEPVYVCSMSIPKNTVTVGTKEHLYTSRLTAGEVNLISLEQIPSGMTVLVKTRYKQKEVPARLYPQPDGTIRVDFIEPVRAVAAGQAAVFYDGDVVLGGGTILAN